jgi:DNA polymerase-3 subunit epsilon
MSALCEHPTGFAVVDIETTGFSPDDERIVEVAVVTLDAGGDEVGSFCTLVDPRRDPGPTHVHGISAAMLEGAPTFDDIRPYLADQLSGRVVVGHNVDCFDLAFIRAECLRCGGAELEPGDVPSLDTLAVAQSHLGLRGKARLVECCTHFGLTWDDHHNALGDARVTAALFRSMRDRLGDDTLGISDLLVSARRSTWPGASALPPALLGRATAPVGTRHRLPPRLRFQPLAWLRRTRSRRATKAPR